jgi:hypothetical protein
MTSIDNMPGVAIALLATRGYLLRRDADRRTIVIPVATFMPRDQAESSISRRLR